MQYQVTLFFYIAVVQTKFIEWDYLLSNVNHIYVVWQKSN